MEKGSNLNDTTSGEVVSFRLRDSTNLCKGAPEKHDIDNSGNRIKSQETPKTEKWAPGRRRSMSDGDKRKEKDSIQKDEERYTKRPVWDVRSRNYKGAHWKFGNDREVISKRYGWNPSFSYEKSSINTRTEDNRDWVTIPSKGKRYRENNNLPRLGESRHPNSSFESSHLYQPPSHRYHQEFIDRRTSSLEYRLQQLALVEMGGNPNLKRQVQRLLEFNLDNLLRQPLSSYNDGNVTVVPTESYRRRLAAEGAIISCGFIIYTLVEDPSNTSKQIKYMICQRRDTIQYVVVILGKYTTDAELNRYIPLMTLEEQNRILSSRYTFTELWDDVWAGQTNTVVQSDRETAQKKFITNKETIIRYAQQCQLEKRYLLEPESLFLKGKRTESDKSDEDCAFREYEEETYCNRDTLTILDNYYAIIEEYKGTDAKTYSTIYFIARAQYPFTLPEREIVRRTIRDYTISNEIGKVDWKTRAEAGTILNPRRTTALTKAEYFIKKYHNMN